MNITEELNKISKKLSDLNDFVNIAQYQWDYLFWHGYKKDGESDLEAKKRFFYSIKTTDENLALSQKIDVMLLRELISICEEENIQYWLDFGTLLGSIRHEGFIPWDDDIDIGVMREDMDGLLKAIEKSDTFRVWNYYIVDTQCCKVVRFMSKKYCIPNFVDIFVYDWCDSQSDETWKKYRELKNISSAEITNLSLTFNNKDIPYSGDPLYRLAVTDDTEKQKIDEIFEGLRAELTTAPSQSTKNALIWAIDDCNFRYYRKGVYDVNDFFPLRKVKFDDLICTIPKNAEKILEMKYGDIYTLPKDILGHRHFDIGNEQFQIYNDILKRGNFE